MFSLRDKNIGIIFSGTYQNGNKLDDTVKEGDSVILKISQESVLVNNVKKMKDGKFEGEICGFEPSFSGEFERVRIGQRVVFLEENIISCGERGNGTGK